MQNCKNVRNEFKKLAKTCKNRIEKLEKRVIPRVCHLVSKKTSKKRSFFNFNDKKYWDKWVKKDIRAF